jgi:hypothetical protein
MPVKKPIKKSPAKKKAAPKKPAHPLMLDGKDWDREKVMAHICDITATSTKSIGKILAAGHEGRDLPSYSTVMKWLSEDSELSDKYARAKEDQADFMAEEILEIADNASNDWMEREDPDNPGFFLNGENIQRSRLRVDSRKWLASKLKPKKYSERHMISGDAEGDPISHNHSIQVSFVKP